jgi:hypothetical protein
LFFYCEEEDERMLRDAGLSLRYCYNPNVDEERFESSSTGWERFMAARFLEVAAAASESSG